MFGAAFVCAGHFVPSSGCPPVPYRSNTESGKRVREERVREERVREERVREERVREERVREERERERERESQRRERVREERDAHSGTALPASPR